ncbi:bifunctional diguanylate cyclase/phosphodiesterase [Thauera linaloolentis]|uniref:PAS/PAC sensor-containing diguanylate cyclase/phosphodiesterase n=1 Tax=Thauera linaloolentis (strain DSM 12138 / JCM 21573 / CCUG 41526 / CIP 105981 / IAM 15112 / NBRC 102519 / 47Lol) TaxID=1123367 RepID=N6Y5Z9_THAL4|nr:EAL domain-containing protein [Thauera linaloolentis]ENO87025.1 PAS/PAC sensor-containing diguanylate cyclase/phosphodiesterase [Thauera linaloolentis 47Lol = DSM 12138]MCM8565801.1 EAL domain-containing protein [Thauera linaloolentis]
MYQNKNVVLLGLVATVVVLNLFVCGMLAHALGNSKARKEAEVRTTVENLSLLLDQSITSSVREIDLALQLIGEQLERELRSGAGFADADTMALIALQQSWLAEIAELRVTDENGMAVLGLGSAPRECASCAGLDFFEAHRAGTDSGLIASKLVRGETPGTWVMIFSRRYERPDGTFAGVVTAVVPTSHFERLLSGLKLGPNGVALMRDLDMTMVARFPPSAAVAAQTGSRGGSLELSDIIASGAGAQSFYSARTADGVNRINAFRRLSLAPAFVVVGWGEDDYLAPWWDEVRKAGVQALIFLLVTTLAAWQLWRLVGASERANQRSRILLQNASDGIHITDLQGDVIEASDAFCRMLGYPRSEIIGMNVSNWDARLTAREALAAIARVHEQGEVCTLETLHRRADGETFPVEVTSFPLDLDGRPVVFHSARDITARKMSEDAVKKLAFFDPLTSLPNRRLLIERLEVALRSCAYHKGRGALLFIDLDNFKAVNDTIGHHEGDRLLQEVAEILLLCVRKDDSVARLGGDEFVVMLEGLNGNCAEAVREADMVANKVLRALCRPFHLGSTEYRGSASIGVTLFGDDPQESIEEPLRRADLAMYQAKMAGRNAVRFFNPQMQAEVSRRAEMDAGLWLALEREQFVLHYQPQVLADGRVVAVEALVRWQHPERGIVPPTEFIALAEENGLIVPLGRWVLEAACMQLARWASDPSRADIAIAVNVSARQFRHERFVDELADILERTGAPPSRLEIELTESSLLADVESVIARMDALKERGVRFSLDDFGTGYSSLAYLKRLPLDQLKIDKGFVRDILVDPNDAAIAKMVIVLAESLGLQVLAEGVETDAQRVFLAGQGCDAYQGYLFSRPLPLEALEAYLGMRRLRGPRRLRAASIRG